MCDQTNGHTGLSIEDSTHRIAEQLTNLSL
jgi:hypothetical protein